jgi:hypothetical protein
MRELTNPLDKIKIASPCAANWDEMYGSERKRFCSECKLNVYNISEMTKQEGENFILRSEGRLCLRIYQRRDGTVITRDCPVGWARVKRRISRFRAAVLSFAGGLLAGILGVGAARALAEFTDYRKIPFSNDNVEFGIYDGMVNNLPEVKENIVGKKTNDKEKVVFGGAVESDNLRDVGVAILTSRF